MTAGPAPLAASIALPSATPSASPSASPSAPPSAAVAAGLTAALEAHRTGNPAEAARHCHRVLDRVPEETEAWHLLALAHLLGGSPQAGIACLHRALALAPGRGDILVNFARAQAENRRWTEAVTTLDRALRLVPHHTEALLILGNARQMTGRLDDAIATYTAAIQTAPGRTDIRRNLGIALRAAGRLDEAMAMFAPLLDASGNGPPNLMVDLAGVLAVKGRLAEAEVLLRRVLDRHPQDLEAAFALGVTLSDLGRWAEAEDVFLAIARLVPTHAPAHQARGAVLKILARTTEAVLCQERALELRRDFPQAVLSLGAALADCGRIDEAIEAARRCLAIKPDMAEARSNLLLALCQSPGISRTALDEEHRSLGRQYGDAAGAVHANPADPDKRLRIGYVSADFRTHSVAYFLEPVLAAHDRGQVEVVCYDASPHHDETSARLQASADRWRPIRAMTTETVAELVRQDGIDILIDLSGHTAGNRLPVFAARPAPVQITWLGYPESTGLPTMDAKITDAVVCPEGEGFASEAPLRLPHGFHCYRPPAEAPDLVPPPMLRTGHVTFGAFHDVPKLSPGVIAAWGQILRRLPNSRLLLKAQQFADPMLRDKIRAMLAVAGVAADRVDILGRVASTAAHLDHYNRVDIALDAFPYNGTTTTCEALWMGVPVVALYGDRPAARMSASLLTQLELPRLVAGDVDEYVRLACELAGAADLTALRVGMRDRFAGSSLGDPAAFTRDLEAALRHAWVAWCRSPQRMVPCS